MKVKVSVYTAVDGWEKTYAKLSACINDIRNDMLSASLLYVCAVLFLSPLPCEALGCFIAVSVPFRLCLMQLLCFVAAFLCFLIIFPYICIA